MASTILTFVGEIVPSQRPALEQVLKELTDLARKPPYKPFSDLPTLHFASVVPFDTEGFPSILVLECNFDGKLDAFLGQLIAVAESWLRRMFACCRDFPAAADTAALAGYLRAHVVKPAAYHIGNVGRSVERIRGEEKLCVGLNEKIDRHMATSGRPTSSDAAYQLIDRERRADGDFGWVDQPHRRQTLWERVWPRAKLVLVGIVAVLLLALIAVALAIVLVVLRRHERRDVPMDPATLDPKRVARLAAQEDHRVQNHLASLTVVKPSWFRRTVLRVVLWAANLRARTSTKGTLNGIPSIHYAHWALIDRGRRLLFLSNFDGSWESYLDDFIDKASPGLTAIWSNTHGFPRTTFLARGGARDGVSFKAFARQSQEPAAVWYAAYADLTVQQIDSHSVRREGLAKPPSGSTLAGWLRRW